MNKREKIIVALAALIGLYGLVDYVFLSEEKTSRQSAAILAEKAKIDEFSNQSVTRLASLEQELNRLNVEYLLEKIETQWESDPFKILNGQFQQIESIEEEVQAIPEMAYSGFIQLGNQYMAVINGMEYMVGETVKEIGVRVLQITPGKVILQTKSNKELILYIEEN